MRVLIINDNSSVLQVLEALVEVVGETPIALLQKPDGYYLGPTLADPLDEIAQADVVLLDHHMPKETGKVLFERWSAKGTVHAPRFVGTSNEDPQDYLAERTMAVDLTRMGIEKFGTFLKTSA